MRPLAGGVGLGQLGVVGVDVLGVPVGRGVTVGGLVFLAILPAGFDGVGGHGLGLNAGTAHADEAFAGHGLLAGVRDVDCEGRFTEFGGGARPELHDACLAGGEAVDGLGAVGKGPGVGDGGGQVDAGDLCRALVGDGDIEDAFAPVVVADDGQGGAVHAGQGVLRVRLVALARDAHVEGRGGLGGEGEDRASVDSNVEGQLRDGAFGGLFTAVGAARQVAGVDDAQVLVGHGVAQAEAVAGWFCDPFLGVTRRVVALSRGGELLARIGARVGDHRVAGGGGHVCLRVGGIFGVDGEAAVRVDRADLVVAVGGGGQLPVVGGCAHGRGAARHAEALSVGQCDRVLVGSEGVTGGVGVGGRFAERVNASLEGLRIRVSLRGLAIPEHLSAVAQAVGDPRLGFMVGHLAVASLPDGDLAAADGGVGHRVTFVLVERVHRPLSVHAVEALHLHDAGGGLIAVVVQGGGRVHEGVSGVDEVLSGQATVGILLAALTLGPVFDDDVLVDGGARDVGDTVVPQAQRAAARLDVRVDLVDEVIEGRVESHRLVTVGGTDLTEKIGELSGSLFEEELVGTYVPFGGAERVHVFVDEVEVELLGGGVNEVEVVGALRARVVGDLELREVAEDGAGVAGSVEERDDADADLAAVLDDGLDFNPSCSRRRRWWPGTCRT